MPFKWKSTGLAEINDTFKHCFSKTQVWKELESVKINCPSLAGCLFCPESRVFTDKGQTVPRPSIFINDPDISGSQTKTLQCEDLSPGLPFS